MSGTTAAWRRSRAWKRRRRSGRAASARTLSANARASATGSRAHSHASASAASADPVHGRAAARAAAHAGKASRCRLTHWPSCGARGHGCACSPTRSGRSRPRACNGWNSDSIAASIRWSDCWRGFGVLASGLQTAHELRLADAGWPQQQQGFAMRYPAAPGELADLPRIERRLGGKVEAVEVAHRGEVGDLPAISTRHSSLRRDLALEQKKGQRLAEGQLAPGGLVPTDCRAGRGSPLA